MHSSLWEKLKPTTQLSTLHLPHTHTGKRYTTRGSHIRVACRSVCACDQESWSVKIVLDRLIAPFWGSWSLDFTGVQRTKHSHASVVSKKMFWLLILVTKDSSWSLDRLQKRMLIAWFHFDPGRKRFYRRRVCDYPLYNNHHVCTPLERRIWWAYQFNWNVCGDRCMCLFNCIHHHSYAAPAGKPIYQTLLSLTGSTRGRYGGKTREGISLVTRPSTCTHTLQPQTMLYDTT